jgi:DNA-binding transcriptional LysR family regulator
MDWENLHVFSVFARQSSLSAAARELKVEHATVARRIAALEQELHLKLVDRRGRSYFLTAEGQRVAEIGKRMEADSFAAERVGQAGQPDIAGEVSLSAPPVLSLHILAPRVAELRRQHPRIALRLITETRTASLHQREADLAIRLSRPTQATLVARRLGRIPFYLYATPEYLASRAPRDWSFFAYDESLERSPQQQWLKAHAGERPIVVASNDLAVQHAAASAGAGIAGLPFFAGDPDASLVRVPSKGPRLVREVWLAVHRDLSRAPAVRAVMELVSCALEDVLGRHDAST